MYYTKMTLSDSTPSSQSVSSSDSSSLTVFSDDTNHPKVKLGSNQQTTLQNENYEKQLDLLRSIPPFRLLPLPESLFYPICQTSPYNPGLQPIQDIPPSYKPLDKETFTSYAGKNIAKYLTMNFRNKLSLFGANQDCPTFPPNRIEFFNTWYRHQPKNSNEENDRDQVLTTIMESMRNNGSITLYKAISNFSVLEDMMGFPRNTLPYYRDLSFLYNKFITNVDFWSYSTNPNSEFSKVYKKDQYLTFFLIVEIPAEARVNMIPIGGPYDEVVLNRMQNFKVCNIGHYHNCNTVIIKCKVV